MSLKSHLQIGLVCSAQQSPGHAAQARTWTRWQNSLTVIHHWRGECARQGERGRKRISVTNGGVEVGLGQTRMGIGRWTRGWQGAVADAERGRQLVNGTIARQRRHTASGEVEIATEPVPELQHSSVMIARRSEWQIGTETGQRGGHWSDGRRGG